ncbi:MAG: DUF2795 domain-containing protein [Chloroflexota bacterium]
MVSTATISQALQGISFPCSKQECVSYARQHNSPQDVLDVLQRLPDRQYFSMAGIWDAVGDIEYSPVSGSRCIRGMEYHPPDRLSPNHSSRLVCAWRSVPPGDGSPVPSAAGIRSTLAERELRSNGEGGDSSWFKESQRRKKYGRQRGRQNRRRESRRKVRSRALRRDPTRAVRRSGISSRRAKARQAAARVQTTTTTRQAAWCNCP